MFIEHLKNKLGKSERRVYSDLPIPAYYQLSRHLMELLYGGNFKEGKKFLSEEKLVEDFDISRPTANKAINVLIDKGFLERKRGKGTFVAKIENIRLYFMQNMSFGGDSGSDKDTSKDTEVLVSEKKRATEYVAASLDVEIDDPILYLRRVRYKGNQKILTDSILPSKRFSGLLDLDLEKASLYSILEEEYKTPVVTVDRSVRATQLLDKNIADELGADLFSPALILRGTASTEDNVKVEHHEGVFPEYVHLTTTIQEQKKNSN